MHWYEPFTLAVFFQSLYLIGQPDGSSLLSTEVMSRRSTLIVHVYSTAKNAKQPSDWAMADTWMGCALLETGVALTNLEREKWMSARLKEKTAVFKEVCKW